MNKRILATLFAFGLISCAPLSVNKSNCIDAARTAVATYKRNHPLIKVGIAEGQLGGIRHSQAYIIYKGKIIWLRTYPYKVEVYQDKIHRGFIPDKFELK